MVIFSFIMRVGVGDEVPGAAGRQGGPKDPGVQGCAPVESVGAPSFASAGLAAAPGSVNG